METEPPHHRSPAAAAAHHRRPPSTAHASVYPRNVLMSKLTLSDPEHAHLSSLAGEPPQPAQPKSVQAIKDFDAKHGELKPPPAAAAGPQHHHGNASSKGGVGVALSDTPLPSQPGSPRQ